MASILFADMPGPGFYLIVFGGMAVAGLALFLGLVLGGLWIARRLDRQRRGPGDGPAADGDVP